MTMKEILERVSIDEDNNYISYVGVMEDGNNIAFDVVDVDDYDNHGYGIRYVETNSTETYDNETGEFALYCDYCLTQEEVDNSDFVGMEINGDEIILYFAI